MAKENKQVAAVTPPDEKQLAAASEANSQEVVGSDVLIPRLLLMQGTSPLVTTRKAQLGDLIKSTTGEKVGDIDHPIDIVPLKMTNTWTLFELIGDQPEFRGSEPRSAANEGLEWEFEKDGTRWKRKKTITLFALRPDDVAAYEAESKRALGSGEAPDLNKTVMPVVITFMSTSFKFAGKKCATFFNTVRVNSQKFPGLAPYSYVLPLQMRSESKGKNNWFVFDLGQAKPLKDAAIKAVAQEWSSILNKGGFRTDDDGVVDEGGSDGDSATEV